MDCGKIFLFCALTIFLNNCSPKVSTYFDSTRYVQSFNTHIVNDSLQLYIKTPADIQYEPDKDVIRKHIKSQDQSFDGLLAYGQTEVAPHYRVYLMLNPKEKINAKNKNEFVRDTLIQNNKLVLYCKNKQPAYSDSFRSDCLKIFKSISSDQNYREGIASILELTERFDNQYYKAMDRILAYPTKGRNEEFLQLQMALNYASFLAPNAAYDSLLNEFPRPSAKDSLKNVIRSKGIHGKQNVFDKILEESKQARLVIFNENHFYPSHRELLTELLPGLKDRGFRYLALEALGETQDSLLNKGLPPTIDSGFYTREPHFAELIRTAKKLEFTFVSYENTDKDKSRELGQAENLYNSTFAQNDSAKVIALAGLDHILERPTQGGKSWLGHLLHKEYNINPLTISQSHLNQYHSIAEPLTLISSDVFNDYKLNSIDWLLLNNFPRYDVQPNYSFTNDFDEPVQAAVFLQSELSKENDYLGVILYRTTLAPDNETIKYHLDSRDYFLVVFDKEGKPLLEEKIRQK